MLYERELIIDFEQSRSAARKIEEAGAALGGIAGGELDDCLAGLRCFWNCRSAEEFTEYAESVQVELENSAKLCGAFAELIRKAADKAQAVERSAEDLFR